MADRTQITRQLVATIAIPESAYDKAKTRYEDLAAWIGRPESRLAPHAPHLYPQGSFRLGTVIRPITDDGEYDLDLGCRLRVGVTKRTHSQKALKDLVGSELDAYRTARQIKSPLEAMHRCWRLAYRDELPFHMDTVPSIPEALDRQGRMREAMVASGVRLDLAEAIAQRAGAITDDRRPNFAQLSEDWYISNSEGYALWFESRMKLAAVLMHDRALEAKVGKVDDLPAYRWRSPLQACIQILKRHRDAMYAAIPERAPISIVITTLAAHAYDGAADVPSALEAILRGMDSFIRTSVPRIPNPVNPAEDFADRWRDPKRLHLDLEGNFHRWLQRARQDYSALVNQRDAAALTEHARRAFSARLNPGTLSASSLLAPAVSGGLSFPSKPVVPARPAGFA